MRDRMHGLKAIEGASLLFSSLLFSSLLFSSLLFSSLLFSSLSSEVVTNFSKTRPPKSEKTRNRGYLRGLSARTERTRGFSLIELVVSLAIIFILAGVALPSFMRAYRDYQLNDLASQMAGILKFTRFDAIRRNMLVACRTKQTGANWVAWTDSNMNGTLDPTEKQTVLTGGVTLLPISSVPNPAPITNALGITSMATLSGANASVQFDSRGAVDFGGTQPTVYAFYLGNPSVPGSSYRAVILLPSGVTQVWRSSAAGDWHQVS